MSTCSSCPASLSKRNRTGLCRSCTARAVIGAHNCVRRPDKCEDCSVPVAKGATKCKACYVKARRAASNPRRICADCDQRLGRNSGSRCEPCADAFDQLRKSGSHRLHLATVAYFERRGAELGCDFAMAGALILNAPERLAA